MNSFNLSKNWFDWTFENTTKVKPVHTALYFFIIDQFNRIGCKQIFSLPTEKTMEFTGIISYKTYINTLLDLDEFGFIRIIERLENQRNANIIEVVNITGFKE